MIFLTKIRTKVLTFALIDQRRHGWARHNQASFILRQANKQPSYKAQRNYNQTCSTPTFKQNLDVRWIKIERKHPPIIIIAFLVPSTEPCPLRLHKYFFSSLPENPPDRDHVPQPALWRPLSRQKFTWEGKDGLNESQPAVPRSVQSSVPMHSPFNVPSAKNAVRESVIRAWSPFRYFRKKGLGMWVGDTGETRAAHRCYWAHSFH